jgi:K+-transporting ATPase ATPase B chain
MKQKKNQFFTVGFILSALARTFMNLSPQVQIRNPVIFVAYLGVIFATILTYLEPTRFHIYLVLWLWLTVFCANLAKTIAERFGKAQISSLKRTQIDNAARKLVHGREISVAATALQRDDLVICEVGDIIPADGEIVEGIATVDESAITGESAPVIRESGGDRSAVTAGTKIISDRIVIQVTAEQGENFLDRMINLIESSAREKTPNEITLNIVLYALTILFLLMIISTKLFDHYSPGSGSLKEITLPALIALLICLIPATISALINAIGISAMNRLIQKNIIAKNSQPIEAAGDIDLLIIDKTGTITLGNRMATEFIPVKPEEEKEFAEIAQLASLSDETPEGRSIVIEAKNKFNLRGEIFDREAMRIVPFSSQTKMSGIDFLDKRGKVIRSIRKGDAEAIEKYIAKREGSFPIQLFSVIERISNEGATPLVVCDGNEVVGIIRLKDVVKSGLKERFATMRGLGIRTIMITGDNAFTAGAIAAEAGVDDYIAQATPEIKLHCIRDQQQLGYLVAMVGDGTSDAPAMAQADVGIAMNTGTQASREAGNMVDLESNPTKILDIIEIGKQMSITRGALTIFSITGDIAKYCALIPMMFSTLYATTGNFGPLRALNFLQLHSFQSAILSTVVFTTILIFLLTPIALKGVPYKPAPTETILRHNLLFYGLSGFLAPLIGIKFLDMIISALLT